MMKSLALVFLTLSLALTGCKRAKLQKTGSTSNQKPSAGARLTPEEKADRDANNGHGRRTFSDADAEEQDDEVRARNRQAHASTWQPGALPPVQAEPVRTPPPKITPVATPLPQWDGKSICVGREGQKCPDFKSVPGSCKLGVLDGERVADKLDLVFVLDTSASLRGGLGTKPGSCTGELVNIAEQMDHLIEQIPDGTDFSIGVILGHGPASPWHARLFKAGADDQEVLNFKSFYNARARKGGTPQQIEADAKKAMYAALRAKMCAVPKESLGAQGEALQLSLYNAIMDKTRLARITAAGLFRPGAALNVTFVTDEQDVCFDYEGYNREHNLLGTPKEVKPRPVKNNIRDPKTKKILRQEMGEDLIEIAFRDSVCKTAVDGKPLTPAHTLQAIRYVDTKVMGDKNGERLIVGAFIYQNEVPEGLGAEDDNEIGWGIKDIIEQAGGAGHIGDLAQVDRKDPTAIKALMAELGQKVEYSMKFRNNFICQTEPKIHVNAIDMRTAVLKIKNQQTGEEYGQFRGDDGSLVAQDIENGDKITRRFHVEDKAYETIRQLLREKSSEWMRSQKSKPADQRTDLPVVYSIDYKTLPLIDPETGDPR